MLKIATKNARVRLQWKKHGQRLSRSARLKKAIRAEDQVRALRCAEAVWGIALRKKRELMVDQGDKIRFSRGGTMFRKV